MNLIVNSLILVQFIQFTIQFGFGQPQLLVDEYLSDRFKMFSQYAVLAYHCTNYQNSFMIYNWNDYVTRLDTSGILSPALTLDTKIIKQFYTYGVENQGGYGFLAYKPISHYNEKSLFIIALEGTSQYSDLYNNIKFRMVPFDAYISNNIDVKAQVHIGFHQIYKGLRKQIIPELLQILQDNMQNDVQLIVTGHSLGGSLALQLMYDLRLIQIHAHKQQLSQYYSFKDIQLELYMYGAPKSGNKHFVKRFEQVMLESYTSDLPNAQYYRIVNHGDYIDKLPLNVFAQYEHVQPVYWIKNDPKQKSWKSVLCKTNDKQSWFQYVVSIGHFLLVRFFFNQDDSCTFSYTNPLKHSQYYYYYDRVMLRCIWWRFTSLSALQSINKQLGLITDSAHSSKLSISKFH